MLRVTGGGRVLHFDIENRPLSYWVPDRPTAEITAIAWGWAGHPEAVQSVALEPPCAHCGTTDNMAEVLKRFYGAYLLADVVTGHYIRRHDLPILNGALIERGLAPLPPKMTSCTKEDLVKWKDLPKSQEYLADLLELQERKYHMGQRQWREANRLGGEGIAQTRARVESDVRTHMELRARLIDLGLLRGPKKWSS